MAIKVNFPPQGFYLRDAYSSESGARQFRQNFINYNKRYTGISGEDVVIYHNLRKEGTMQGAWEVWVRS